MYVYTTNIRGMYSRANSVSPKLPFLRLATPLATYPVTFHVSAVTPVTAAGNAIRLVTAVVVVEWSCKPAGTIHAFVHSRSALSRIGRGRVSRDDLIEERNAWIFQILSGKSSDPLGLTKRPARGPVKPRASSGPRCAHGGAPAVPFRVLFPG